MNYSELESHLIYFSVMENKYGEIDNKRIKDEIDYEQLGCISGELHETAEILRGSLTDTKENFDLIIRFLKASCPNTYDIVIDKIKDTRYKTLYDVLCEINMKREDDFYFPTKIMKQISIYR